MSYKCKLLSEDFPPISELDHIQGNCFCYLCTCGIHKCPSLNTYQRPSPKLLSSYQHGFNHKQVTPPEPFQFLDEFQVSKQKMDLKSTAKEEFKGKKLEFPKINEIRYGSVSPLRFCGSSTYSKTFLNYGPIQKSPSQITKSDFSPIKFSAVSTYAQNYIKHEKITENFDKQIKKGNILGAGGTAIMETTNHAAYQPHKNTLISKPYVRSSLDHVSGASSPVLKTTYAASFLDISPKKMPPTLKKTLN
ncbi:hypothetical protein SteCoe_26346 [Stentor coeruleus]|uniref:Uncharacterized protein n=1 Tax=Stentor coeruleus TaxID=5963 RepID=A0A1R2BD24_9CILI|nr:hypothetical protein SteCoe_26346 [Stentor coeruleus]